MFKPIPVILFLYVTLHFASSMQLPIFPLYIQDIVKDVRHIGSLYALFAVFVACSMVFAGYLGKTAKIYFWIAGYFIYGLYSLALYYEPSVVVLYGLQIVGGAAYGMACACLRFILSYMETGSDGYAKTFNTMKLLSLFLGSV